MRFFSSLAIAFSTYSKIPMPSFDFEEDNMRYSLCFFPMIGAVIGAAFLFVRWAAGALHLGPILTGALLCLTPLLITGGIHMDGFMDTIDALSSWQGREKRLEILKDPHVGAFGAMGAGAYLILGLGVMSEAMPASAALVVALTFVLSRALSGALLLVLKSAKEGGLLYAFKQSAEKNTVLGVLFSLALICAVLMLAIDPARGARALVAALLSILYYRHVAYRHFGGVTGDLAGFFLQICELAAALAAVIP